MNVGPEERRLATEVIATLVNVKDTMAKLILKPAGVPSEIYDPYIEDRSYTGLSKRQMAPLIIDEVEKRGYGSQVVVAIIRIASEWGEHRYHLAKDEYVARGVVMKARDVMGQFRVVEEQETKRREQDREKERLRQEQERERVQQEQVKVFNQQLEKLLQWYDGMFRTEEAHNRGYQLEQLLNQIFILFDIPIHEGSFRRNKGGEQIDGAFRFDGVSYLVECKWHTKLSDMSQLDALQGKLNRSGGKVIGLFLSIIGWSINVPELLKQNPEKSIILMDGLDLRCILAGQVSLKELLTAKLTNFNFRSEPYLGVNDYLKGRK